MPTKRRTTSRETKPSPLASAAAAVRTLERRVRRLERELAAAGERHERRVELVRRAANRRLAVMMQEIAALRHHEARAEALERLLATHESSAVPQGASHGQDPRLPG
jgi:predicted Holliday junction resolvase-like endonuclease